MRGLLLALRRCRLGFCSAHCLHSSAHAMTIYYFLTTAWEWNPVLLLFCSLALAGYFLAFRLRGRPAYFIGALVIFLVTLLSPLSALANGYLFSAHMVQHIVLVLIVPALLWLSLPHSLSLPRSFATLIHPLIG